MPNRILKESICTSEKIASLTDFEFRLWVALITQADDMGRGDARPAIIKGRAFPLRDRIAVRDIDAGLHGLAAKGCVSLYTVGGKPYFWFPTWQKHQRIRECKAKYPGPEEADGLPRPAAACGNPPQSAAACRLNPIQSESESNPNPESQGPRVPQGDWDMPPGPLLDALRDFEAMRQKAKKPMTPRARKLLLENLRNLSQDQGEQVAILEQSILHSWRDVYPLKAKPQNASGDTSYDLGEIKRLMEGCAP